MNQIILYGLSGADTQYRALKYYCIYEDALATDIIGTVKRRAALLVMQNPGIKHVYAVSNRPGLKAEYIQSYKINSIESCAIFKDTLEREGLLVY
jgi:hypothetical protein